MLFIIYRIFAFSIPVEAVVVGEQETAELVIQQQPQECIPPDEIPPAHIEEHMITTAGGGEKQNEEQEDERHIEITIGDPVADKVIDSCVGTVCLFNL